MKRMNLKANISRTKSLRKDISNFWNRLCIPDGQALSEKKKLDNWLNYKRECELWHYEGWKTSRYRKWERNVQHKQIRAETKIELSKAINEYFETE